MLMRAAATEIGPRQQHLGALVARLVEHEIRVLRATGIVLSGLTDIHVTPFVEGIRAEAGTLDRLQELLRNDGIGIDIAAIERRHQTIETNKFFHEGAYLVDFWMASPPFSMSLPMPATVLQPLAKMKAAAVNAKKVPIFKINSFLTERRERRQSDRLWPPPPPSPD